MIKLENTYLAISPAGKGYLMAAYGSAVPEGLLKIRLQLLSEYFKKVFEQLK